MKRPELKDRAPNFIDRTGYKFNSWEVIEFVKVVNRRSIYLCRCVCGFEKTRDIHGLVTGVSKSCGCVNAKNHTTHGYSDKRVYNIWQGIKTRVKSKDAHKMKYYGDRGITICKEWDASFEVFLSDMGLPPSELHTIDRINNDGNYEPSNCRWATMSQQAYNRRPKTLPAPPTTK